MSATLLFLAASRDGGDRVKKTIVGAMILLAAWAVCCLAIPTALWGPYIHDIGRYLLFSPNGELLPTIVPLALLYAAALIFVIIISKKLIRARLFRATLLVLAALAGMTGILIALSGATLLALFPFGFAAVCGMIYVTYAERHLFQNFGKGGAL